MCIDNTDTFLCSLLLDAIGVLIVSYGKVPVQVARLAALLYARAAKARLFSSEVSNLSQPNLLYTQHDGNSDAA